MNIEDNKIINEIKNKYNNDLKYISEQYNIESYAFNLNSFRNCMNYQEKIIVNIIKDVIDKFDELKYADFIVLNGSYARGTNIYSSDLDFNILYSDNYKNKLFNIEMRINYIISKILDFKGCDRIHSIMVYTPLISNDNIYFDGTNLIFNNNKIKYYFREGYGKLLYETYNSSRNYKTLLNYFNDNRLNNSIFNEWTNTFLLVRDFGKYNDFKNNIKLHNELIKNSDNFKLLCIKEINELLVSIEKQIYISNTKTVKIKELKHIYKSYPTSIIYKFLSIISRIYNFNNINIKTLYKSKIINDKIYNNIHHYLFYICRIQLVLDSMNLDLSSHSTKVIDSINFNNKYYNIYNEDVFTSTNNIIKTIYTDIKNSLLKEMENLNG